MITMMGIIDFNNEMAPDIFLRLGDTGRETSLTPAAPVALEGLTASLYMAKPDNTFVIAACTIAEDSIIIAWPEQAAAAKGFGEYCIRLKDSNDLVIYSARGNVIIDDHVITDSMIESIAEANGYLFPDEFATKDEIPDIEDIIDDDDIIDDKTWSSIKIDDITSSLQSQLQLIIDDDHTASNSTWSSSKIDDMFESIYNYSTSEKAVGEWTDGKTLYRKTIYFSNSDLTNETFGAYLSIPITNIDKAYMVDILLSGTILVPYYQHSDLFIGGFAGIGTNAYEFHFRYGSHVQSDRAAFFDNSIITIYYTKSS